MTNEKSTLDMMLATIEQLRDEIKLKAHLGKAEAKDELNKLDRKWESLLEQYKPVADEAGKAAENAGAALGLAADEIKAGYERIRKLL
jgi:archaellum component FlaC